MTSVMTISFEKEELQEAIGALETEIELEEDLVNDMAVKFEDKHFAQTHIDQLRPLLERLRQVLKDWPDV